MLILREHCMQKTRIWCIRYDVDCPHSEGAVWVYLLTPQDAYTHILGCDCRDHLFCPPRAQSIVALLSGAEYRNSSSRSFAALENPRHSKTNSLHHRLKPFQLHFQSSRVPQHEFSIASPPPSHSCPPEASISLPSRIPRRSLPQPILHISLFQHHRPRFCAHLPPHASPLPMRQNVLWSVPILRADSEGVAGCWRNPPAGRRAQRWTREQQQPVGLDEWRHAWSRFTHRGPIGPKGRY